MDACIYSFVLMTSYKMMDQAEAAKALAEAKAKVKPLPLTPDEKRIVSDYLKEFQAWHNYKYDDDPLDAFKVSEYLCMCERMKERFTELYKHVPQCVKDEYLVPRPEYPHSPRRIKRSPSWCKVLEVVW